MKQRNLRWLVLIVVVFATLGLPFMASAIPTGCGFVKVTVFTTPVSAPGVPYCNDDCPGGISQGPNDPGWGPVTFESYECVKNL